jgi:hypothetical protein
VDTVYQPCDKKYKEIGNRDVIFLAHLKKTQKLAY